MEVVIWVYNGGSNHPENALSKQCPNAKATPTFKLEIRVKHAY